MTIGRALALFAAVGVASGVTVGFSYGWFPGALVAVWAVSGAVLARNAHRIGQEQRDRALLRIVAGIRDSAIDADARDLVARAEATLARHGERPVTGHQRAQAVSEVSTALRRITGAP